jgi:hypothetical protein
MENYTATLTCNKAKVVFVLDDLSEFTIVIWNGKPFIGPAIVAVERVPAIEGSLEYTMLQIPYENVIGEISDAAALRIVADWFSKNTRYQDMNDNARWELSIGEVLDRDFMHNSWLDFKHANGNVTRVDISK